MKNSEIYQIEISPTFKPFRRSIEIFEFKEIPIQPLIERLHFIPNKKSWGYPFRWGFLEIDEHDFKVIANEMLENTEKLAM